MALVAIKGEKMSAELAEQFDVHANQITQWKGRLPEGASNPVVPSSSIQTRAQQSPPLQALNRISAALPDLTRARRAMMDRSGLIENLLQSSRNRRDATGPRNQRSRDAGLGWALS